VILRLTAERPSLSKFSGRWVGDFGELKRALAELEGMWRAWGKEVGELFRLRSSLQQCF
jgi:hypothetical protein